MDSSLLALETRQVDMSYIISHNTHTHTHTENRQAYGSHGSSASSSASSSNHHHSSSSHSNQQQRPHSDNSNTNNRTNGSIHPYQARMRHSSSISSSSEFTSVSQQPVRQTLSDKEQDRVSIRSGRIGNLGVAANLAQSRESFQQALDNPCEYFIDVM